MDYLEDRRKHQRYILRQGVFAGFSPNMGEVVNLSVGGIRYHYLDFGKVVEERSDFIICSEDGCCLESFPCRVVSDNVLANESSLSQIVTRRRRVMFGELTDMQHALLTGFIECHKRPESEEEARPAEALDEQRQAKRFLVNKQTSFVENSKWPGQGMLVDISKGGFAFHYVSKTPWSDGSDEGCMVIGAHDSRLTNVPATVVSDRIIQCGQGTPRIVRRRSLKFGDLDPQQKFLLECFIWINGNTTPVLMTSTQPAGDAAQDPGATP